MPAPLDPGPAREEGARRDPLVEGGRQSRWQRLDEPMSQHVHPFVSVWEIPFFTSIAPFRWFTRACLLGLFEFIRGAAFLHIRFDLVLL
jgi:hypothetical protein